MRSGHADNEFCLFSFELELEYHTFSSSLCVFLQHPDHEPSMHVYEAWLMGYTGEGVVAGVVDTGIEPDHDDLIANYVSHIQL